MQDAEHSWMEPGSRVPRGHGGAGRPPGAQSIARFPSEIKKRNPPCCKKSLLLSLSTALEGEQEEFPLGGIAVLCTTRGCGEGSECPAIPRCDLHPVSHGSTNSPAFFLLLPQTIPACSGKYRPPGKEPRGRQRGQRLPPAPTAEGSTRFLLSLDTKPQPGCVTGLVCQQLWYS